MGRKKREVMKKILSLFISLLFILNCTMPALAIAEDESPYEEEITIRFQDANLRERYGMNSRFATETEKLFYVEQARMQVEKEGFDIGYDEIKAMVNKAYERSYEINGKIAAISMKNVYCTNEINGEEIESTLMSKREVEEMRRAGTTDRASKPKEKLTLTLTAIKRTYPGCDIAYDVTSEATWASMGSTGYSFPAPGDDALVIGWGGDLYERTNNVKIKNFKGEQVQPTSTMSSNNKGFLVTFADEKDYTTAANTVKNVNTKLLLTKNHAAGELTGITAIYVHTYKKINWNFSIGAGASEAGASVSVGITPQNETKHWKLTLNVKGLSY